MTMTTKQCEVIYRKAMTAANEAFHAAKPTPMIVGTPKTLFGNEIDYSQKTYYVADGVCGFAWVHITSGRGKFVKFLKEIKAGHTGYRGGFDMSLKGDAAYSQSMERKEAAARAAAEVLRDAGIEAYCESRID